MTSQTESDEAVVWSACYVEPKDAKQGSYQDGMSNSNMETPAYHEHTPSKRLRVDDVPGCTPSTPAARAVGPAAPSTATPTAPAPLTQRAQPRTATQHSLQPPLDEHGLLLSGEWIVLMMLDVEEAIAGHGFHVWGKLHSNSSATVLLRIEDFALYWFIPSPVACNPDGTPCIAGNDRDGAAVVAPVLWPSDRLERLRSLLNMRLPADCHVARISEQISRPIMYYRPSEPHGSSFLRLELAPGCGGSVRKAATAVHALCKEGQFISHGFAFPVRQDYEAEVRPLTRFMCDASLSGGSWLAIPSSNYPATPHGGYRMAHDRVSTCTLEVVAPWRSLVSLSADATQLADSSWKPQLGPLAHAWPTTAPAAGLSSHAAGTSVMGDETGEQRHTEHQAGRSEPWFPRFSAALAAAARGEILPLRVAVIDVLTAPRDARRRAPCVAADDPVIAISVELRAHNQLLGATAATATSSGYGAGPGAGEDGGNMQQLGAGSRDTAVLSRQPPGATREEAGEDEARVISLLSGSDEDEIEESEEEGGGGWGIRMRSNASTGRSLPLRRSLYTSHSAHQGSTAVQRPQAAVFVLGSSGGPAARNGQVSSEVTGGWQQLGVGGAHVIACGSEVELLSRWREWVVGVDPDVLATFQVRDTLGALVARAAAIKLPLSRGPAISRGLAPSGTGLQLSRLLPRHGVPLATKSVVMYSPSWVKSQSRMSSTSNQETFKATGLSGRLVFDVLRQVLTAKSLATFTLVDCCQTVLGRTLEVLGPAQLAGLWLTAAGCTPSEHAAGAGPGTGRQVAGGPVGRAQAESPGGRGAGRGKGVASGGRGAQAKGGNGWGAGRHAPSQGAGAGKSQAGSGLSGAALRGSDAEGERERLKSLVAPEGGDVAAGSAMVVARSSAAAAARLARYCLDRMAAVRGLTATLATVPDAFEMARVTGLSLAEVQYKAQMVRTWSLLLRNARRHGYLVGGRQEATQLIESPYLMHPIESRTAALYRAPVACLDFASLYPSIYRAHNLCYTTLVVPEDVGQVGADNVFTSPSGHAFLKPHVREGILPAILAALMSARTATRASLKSIPKADAAAAAVLDARQKALKVMANALYGFTGAQASMLQCAPIANSCLAYGAAACRTAIAAVHTLRDEGVLGVAGRDARVIYAQTDSVFVHFPHADTAQAVHLGKQLSELVTSRWFQAPMELKYEKVYRPFLLLHVNRYAGKAFESEGQAAGDTRGAGGELVIKGIRAIWRQSAPFIANTLQGVVERIVVGEDIPGAVSFCESQIFRLLSGKVELWELIMTGGLWRITGQQVASAAAQQGNTGEGAQAGGGGSGGAAGEVVGEEVRGPHASLAVRLVGRDPGRTFLLGERIQYVLLSGMRLQDDAAEDPLTAAQAALAPNLELYWRNKLQAPLTEILDKVLNASQLQALMSGPHTLVRSEQVASSSVGGTPEAVAAAAAASGAGGNVVDGAGPKAAAGAKAGGGRQVGLTAFFKHKPLCLSCRQPVHMPASAPQAASATGGEPLAPGLCDACKTSPGRWAALTCVTQLEAAAQQQKLTAAVSQCMRCHSGGMAGPVLCTNAECNVLYERLGAARRVAGVELRMRRLELSAPTDMAKVYQW